MLAHHVSSQLTALAATAALALLGCVAAHGEGSVAARQIAAADLPAAWEPGSSADLLTVEGLETDRQWWRTFGLPALDSLVADGLAHNYDIEATLHRLEAARLAIRQARAAYYPTVGVGASWSRERSGGALAGADVPNSYSGSWGVSADASWQIDVFGRVRAGVKEKKALWRVSRAELAGMQLSVAAEIADDYVQLVTLWRERNITQMHIQSQDTLLAKVEARYRAGLVPGYDVAQSKTVCYSTQATLPLYDAQIRTLVNALAVLTGRMPSQIDALQTMGSTIYNEQPDAWTPALVPPAELLRRRPDIMQAEATLQADAAAVGVARKDLLPTLSLEASAGTYAADAKRLFHGNSWGWAVAPKLSWTLFDGLARTTAVQEARQQMEADIESYNLTVTQAVAEVDNALMNRASAVEQAHFLYLTLQQAQHYYDGIVSEYLSGLASYSDVAQAQISLLGYAKSYVDARSQALRAVIALYKAMGGGWQLPDEN